MRRQTVHGWRRPCMRFVAWVSVYRLLNPLMFLTVHANPSKASLH